MSLQALQKEIDWWTGYVLDGKSRGTLNGNLPGVCQVLIFHKKEVKFIPCYKALFNGEPCPVWSVTGEEGCDGTPWHETSQCAGKEFSDGRDADYLMLLFLLDVKQMLIEQGRRYRMSDGVKALYRYDAEFWEECEGGSIEGEIKLFSYLVRRETPGGYWISVNSARKLKWVSNYARKRFAYPSKRAALISFVARKRKQVEILGYNLRTMQGAVRKAEEMLHQEEAKDAQDRA